jgi:hypothetical protein
MPYYKFNSNDVYINTLKTYPSAKFIIYSSSVFYNNTPNLSGAYSNPIRLTNAGHVSLYELNIDRHYSASSIRLIGPSGPEGTTTPDKGLIYPWVVKNGSRIGMRTTAGASFNTLNYGDVIFGEYPLTASISKEYYWASTPRYSSTPVAERAWVSHLLSLKNTINSYEYLNPNFTYGPDGPVSRNLDTVAVGLVSIPTIFYGSAIKKGTVDLRYYYTGSVIGRAQDTNRDGVLYETTGSRTGSPIGLVLYGEGFLILTASYRLGSLSDTDGYLQTGRPPTVAGDNPRWVYFAQSISGTIHAPKSTWILDMSGTSTTQTLTMFAMAPKGDLNQSNNPTFRQYSTGSYATTSSTVYMENQNIRIKNVVSSSYNDPTGSFEKTTYISRVGVYDDERNLIGIAKLAMPVKKTANRSFTFKIKTDI